MSSEPALAGVLKKSAVIERGGEKLGLIGLTTEDVDEISSPGPNVIPLDSVTAVQAEVDALTAVGVNKIIVLSHSGYNTDQMVAANTTGVDVIVGGHTNTYLSNTSDRAQGPYPTMVGDTAIVQAYAYGKFLGELNVTFDDAGKVVSASGEPRITDIMVGQGGGFVPLDPDKTYGVVTNNFVRNGGDGYAMFKDGMNAYDYGPDLVDVVVDYMVAQGSYAPCTDGRIVIR